MGSKVYVPSTLCFTLYGVFLPLYSVIQYVLSTPAPDKGGREGGYVLIQSTCGLLHKILHWLGLLDSSLTLTALLCTW